MVTVEDVTDDDDEQQNLPETSTTIDNSSSTKTLQEQKARDEAEARRLRILKSCNERMGLVEGTLPKSTATATTTTTTMNEVVNTDEPVVGSISSDTNINDNEDTGAVDLTSLVPKATGNTSASSAKRMAAMRRMRFKKSPATSSAATPDGGSTEESDELTKSEPGPVSTENDPVVSEIDPTSVSNIENNKCDNDNDNDDEAASEIQTTTEDVAAPKKYHGVAKMRRRMIKERQLKQDEDERNESEEPAALVLAKQRALKSLQQKKNVATALKVTLPLYMSIVTLILLFVAGLDVGLHQGYLDYGIERELVTIHTTLAPRQLGARLHGIVKVGGDGGISKSKVMNVDGDGDGDTINDDEGSDEFADITKPYRVVDEESNIDPLFGVDLDKITAGSGLYFTVARFAVQCHRANLAFFYYLPRKIFTTIANMILQLVDSPPLLCLVAVVIRQVIGKAILGANVPSLNDVTESAAGQSKDMFSMAKSFVSNAITKSFPTAALLYDAWVHVRADMYVILFGFLVGVAYVHSKDGTNNSLINVSFDNNNVLRQTDEL